MNLAEKNAAAVAKIKERCHDARITTADLCEQAKVARSTFWRAENEPERATVGTLKKLENKLAEIEAERAVA